MNSRPPVPQIAVAAITRCFDTENVLQEIPKLPKVFRGLQNIEFGSVRADDPDQGTALANLDRVLRLPEFKSGGWLATRLAAARSRVRGAIRSRQQCPRNRTICCAAANSPFVPQAGMPACCTLYPQRPKPEIQGAALAVRSSDIRARVRLRNCGGRPCSARAAK